MLGRVLGAKDLVSAFEPITSSFLKRLTSRQHEKSRHHLKVGVCVSGGPDSMALAHLISIMPPIQDVQLMPVAMIVDHHVRPESTDEALSVKDVLQRVGITSTILSMSWPEGSCPSQLPNFETEARKKRYRLIAFAALENQIQHIFTGHHMDDQVETALMRLAYQQHGSLLGLRGILSSSAIPCCDDIQGAHEERASTQLPTSALRKPPLNFRPGSYHESYSNIAADIENRFFNRGGLSLHRPLLGVRKADLVATCMSNNISFVTDATNDDPTFTKRNAIRALRSSSNLPMALQETRILELRARAESWVENVLSSGVHMLDSCVIHTLDLSTGTVEVELPQLQDGASQYLGLSNAVARLTGLVAPVARSEIPLQIPEHVLSELLSPSLKRASRNGPITPVDFRHTRFAYDVETRRWTLDRQQMRREEIEENSWRFPAVEKHYTDHSGKNYYQTTWELWDHRYWIRLTCNDAQTLDNIRICPLTKDKLSKLYKTLTKSRAQQAEATLAQLKAVLKHAAPGKRRYTLPVLTIDDHVILLPTLNLHVANPTYLVAASIISEVRYKTVNGIEHFRMVHDKRARKGTP